MRRFRPPLSVFLLLVGLFVCSSSVLPLTWDEGESIDRAEILMQTGRWEYILTKEGHPAGYAVVIGVGTTSAKTPLFSPLDFKTQYRLGPILFISFALTATFWRLTKLFGTTTAVFSLVTIISIPRLFVHLQLADCEPALIGSWLLAWCLFPIAVKNQDDNPCRNNVFRIGGRSILWGIFLGATVSSKFTGVAIFLPFAFFTALLLVTKRLRFRQCAVVWSVAIVTALLTFFAIHPILWTDPIGGIVTFVANNRLRTDYNVSVLFFGELYDMHHPLPWYNTIVWTMITVPFGFLIIAGAGLYRLFQRRQNEDNGHYRNVKWDILSVFLHFVTLIILRALPGVPVHDGIRLFAPAFPFLGILIGIAAAELWERTRINRLKFVRSVIIAIYLTACFNMFWYAPQWLSYYNCVLGGLRGATACGFEPTYFWDGFDHEVIRWLNEHTEPNERVAFSVCSPKTLTLYRRHGKIRFEPMPMPADFSLEKIKRYGCRYYVLQRRPSAEFERDTEFINHATPVFVKTVRQGGVGPYDLRSTPILEIYRLP